MNGYNDNITNDQLAKLRQLFPEAFTEDKIDWARLKATLGEAVDLGERYGLSWKGKSDVFAAIQEKTVQTLHPDQANSVDWDTTGNMFIEGDNLAALKILHKSYYGKVKMIYIDPPYNTGNDFVYNDDFKQTRKSYEAEAGITDDEGNVTRDDGLRSNTGGHKHSNWLNMMYPRLFLARNLLRQDGVIFVSIDDNEVHNLRLMMNEIFGEENFVADFVWKHRKSSQNDTDVSLSHNYTLCYARRRDDFRLTPLDVDSSKFSNPDNDPRGLWVADPFDAPNIRENLTYPIVNPLTGEQHLPPGGRCWRFSKEKFASALADNRVVWGKNGKGRPQLKRFLSDAKDKGKNPFTIWDHIGTATDGTKELMRLFDGNKIFDTPKPVSFLREVLKISTNKTDDDICLDFFGGSGSFAHAVMQLNAEDSGNRQWICVQLGERTDEKSEAFKAGYHTIADISRERIRRAGAKIKADFADKLSEREVPLDLGFRAYTIGESNFKRWNEQVSTAEEIRQQTLESIDPLEPNATDDNILTEILLKRGISPLVALEQHDGYLFVPSESLAISLGANLTEAGFARLLDSGAEQIVLLSRAFGDDANLKANAMLQAEQRGVRVEVV
jgi:adenine specific DNA methylase mod